MSLIVIISAIFTSLYSEEIAKSFPRIESAAFYRVAPGMEYTFSSIDADSDSEDVEGEFDYTTHADAQYGFITSLLVREMTYGSII